MVSHNGNMSPVEHPYDVVVIGGGASGTALLYVLSRYTNILRIALIEKYPAIGLVNSNAKNNSQTLHVGEIETNYSIEKVRQVHPASMMVKRYTDSLPSKERMSIIRRVQKMVLAVGAQEVAVLEKRYHSLRDIFPSLQKLVGHDIAAAEPEVMRGRDPSQKVSALFNPEGYAVNFGLLAQSFVDQVKSRGSADVMLDTTVIEIAPNTNGYAIRTNKGVLFARVIVLDTDAYSLGFAKRLGYGKEFSLIPIAGSFYFTPRRLKGKVYRVQDPRMPFAAVHGDPELTRDGLTRWGPTARFYPVLEARRLNTMLSFFRSSGFERPQTWISFISILLEPVRFGYLLKNFLYDLPIVGTYFLLPQLRLIIPTMRASELARAKGYGGMRLQRVDTRTRELLLGEGKIIGTNIIFNMTPSPGASVCLYNAMRDAEQIVRFLNEYSFDKERMLRDLCVPDTPVTGADVSLKDSYAS